MIRSPINSVA